MVRLALLSGSVLFLAACHGSSGNPAPPPVAPQACPVPPVHSEDTNAEYVPEFLDERVTCGTWRPSEGDGRVIRVYHREGVYVLRKTKRLSEATFLRLQQRVAFYKNAHPERAERRIWIFCDVLEGDDKI